MSGWLLDFLGFNWLNEFEDVLIVMQAALEDEDLDEGGEGEDVEADSGDEE
jgi:hypothetical protein